MTVEYKPSEIYTQRYETFRHLDKLRWQMLQLLVAVASATALVLRSTTGPMEWWFFAPLGFALLMIAFVMLRVGEAIRRNTEVLAQAAEAVGDHSIPDTSDKWKSVAYWLAIFVIFLGVGLLLYSAHLIQNS